MDVEPVTHEKTAGKEGITLVLLHAAGLDSTIWDEFSRILQEQPGMTTLAIDLPGHGSRVNDLPDDGKPTLSTISEAVFRVIQEIEGPVVAVGVSLGGVVAQMVALRRPSNLVGIVLSGTLFEPEPAVRALLEARAEETRRIGMPGMIDATLERWFPESAKLSDADVVEHVRSVLKNADTSVNVRVWDALASLALSDQLSQVLVPVLVLNGSEDRSCPPAVGRELALRLPAAKFVEILGAGHLLPIERPQIVADHVLSFVESLER